MGTNCSCVEILNNDIGAIEKKRTIKVKRKYTRGKSRKLTKKRTGAHQTFIFTLGFKAECKMIIYSIVNAVLKKKMPNTKKQISIDIV